MKDHIGTRTIGQVRSHAQKYFQKQKGDSGSQKPTPTHSPDITATTAPSDTTTTTVNTTTSTTTTSNPAPSGKHLPSHNTPWTAEEQKAFAEGLSLYGKGNWKVISSHIGSRTPLQVKYPSYSR